MLMEPVPIEEVENKYSGIQKLSAKLATDRVYIIIEPICGRDRLQKKLLQLQRVWTFSKALQKLGSSFFFLNQQFITQSMRAEVATL